MRERWQAEVAWLTVLPSWLRSGGIAAPALRRATEMPDDFVYLRDIDPTIHQDMRYAGANNFTGKHVPGYEAPECVLVRQAAEALKAVQADLRGQGAHAQASMIAIARHARSPPSSLGRRLPDDPEGQGDVVPQSATRPTCFPITSPRAQAIRAAPRSTSPWCRLTRRRRRRQARPRSRGRAPRRNRGRPPTAASPWARASIASTGSRRSSRQTSRPSRMPTASAGRRHACARLQGLRYGVVALHVRARALPRHLFRLSDHAASRQRGSALTLRSERSECLEGW